MGALKGIPESVVVRAIEDLLAEGRLVPKGKKYPTVWIPDKRVRKPAGEGTPRRARGFQPSSPLERSLYNLRRREARKRRIKAYQVFDNRTLTAIAAAAPSDPESLAEVPGMGPARMKRYGPTILELVREARG